MQRLNRAYGRGVERVTVVNLSGVGIGTQKHQTVFLNANKCQGFLI